MRLNNFIIIGFLFLSISGIAQHFEVNENYRNAYQYILALNFNRGREIIAGEKSKDPDNLYTLYLENYIDFLTVFISEDEDIFDSIKDISDERYDQLQQMEKENPYRNYLLGNMNLQWAVIRLKFHDYFYAALDINRAYRLLTTNKKAFPDFVPNDITLGVLHIMIGMVPDNYHWVLRLINMKGSVKQGRGELIRALDRSDSDPAYSYLKNEILFFMGFVELNIEPGKKQLDILSGQIARADTNNLLLSYLRVNILMKTGKNDEALQLFERINRMNGYFPFYYLNYLQGECYLRKLEPRQAGPFYDDFLNHFTGKNYIKDTWRKKAWTALLSGDEMKYRYFLKKVLETGNDDTGQDRDAEREAEKNKIPNIDLIKVRLLFDGGYYQKADSILSSLPDGQLNEEERVEKVYRKARIADESGDKDIAGYYYMQTIEEGKHLPRYFAGNSALKLAEMYETGGDTIHALKYYNLCLKLDFDEYEAGIHGKAKAGVKRLSD
ncbi:MAG: hypothetical protein GXO86_03125 [Chlorobi bacterium]|nr:hypothetical protein [Chlorobiota bacterium]